MLGIAYVRNVVGSMRGCIGSGARGLVVIRRVERMIRWDRKVV